MSSKKDKKKRNISVLICFVGLAAAIIAGKAVISASKQHLRAEIEDVWYFGVNEDDTISKRIDKDDVPYLRLSPDGERAVIIYTLTSSKKLSEVKREGKFRLRILSRKEIIDLPIPDVYFLPFSWMPSYSINWSPDSAKISLFGEGKYGNDRELFIWLFDLKSKDFKMLKGVRGGSIPILVYQPWSCDSAKLLVARYDKSRERFNFKIYRIEDSVEEDVTSLDARNIRPKKIFAIWDCDKNKAYLWRHGEGIWEINISNNKYRKTRMFKLPSYSLKWSDSYFLANSGLMLVDFYPEDEREKFGIFDLRAQKFIYLCQIPFLLGANEEELTSAFDPSILSGNVFPHKSGRIILVLPFSHFFLPPRYYWLIYINHNHKVKVIRGESPISKDEVILDVRWTEDPHTLFIATTNSSISDKVPRTKFIKVYKLKLIY